jgi:hypothetical protein
LRSAADRCGELRAAIYDRYRGGEQHTPFPDQLASLLAVHRAIAIPDLREASPRAQALVLSANLDRAETARAIVAGGAGALDKAVVSTRSSTPSAPTSRSDPPIVPVLPAELVDAARGGSG